MRDSDFVVDRGQMSIRWRAEPARGRTVLQNGAARRYQFPALAFAQTYVGGYFQDLRVYVLPDADAAEQLDRGTRLRFWAWQHLKVCLGGALLAAQRGSIDPVDAFWMTDFRGWSDDAMRALASPGSHGMRQRDLGEVSDALLGT